MNVRLLLLAGLFFVNPLFTHEQEEHASIKPFIYGIAFGAVGTGIFIATRGKIDPLSKLYFTLPWNRQRQELQNLATKLEQLTQQQANQAHSLTEIKTGLAAQKITLEEHKKQLSDVLKTTQKTADTVDEIQKQTMRIEAHTSALHGAMIESLKAFQSHSGPINNFLSWFSPKNRQITPTTSKELPEISSKLSKND